MRSPFKLVSIVALVGVAAWASPACTNQGEGELCDTRNGDDDCQSDLKCATSLNASIAPVVPKELLNFRGRCCPPNAATAIAPICQIAGAGLGLDPSVPDGGPAPDAELPDATTPDTTPDTDADADPG